MSVSFGTFSNGSQMVAANLLTNLNLGAAYLQGGVVSGDIPSASIRTPSVFRPDWYSFPVQGYYGVSQSGHGRWVDQSYRFLQSDSRVEFIVADFAADDVIHPLLFWGASIDLAESSLVRVYADGQVAGFCNFTDGAHFMAKVGHLSLCYRDRATRTVTEVALSRRDVYAGGGNGEYLFCNMNLLMLETLPAGSYDVFVAYTRASGGVVSADTRALSFGTRTMSVRAFRGQ
jgi:hypothetical protein